jgi:uncharacterized protein DUF5678
MALPETMVEQREGAAIPEVRFRNLDWFLEHFNELAEAYPDQWLAIRDAAVVAHAGTARELAQVVHARGIVGPLIASTNPAAWASYK